MLAAGRWLFARRGWLLAPLAIGLCLAARGPGALFGPGAALIGAGLALRLWGVAYIGPGSRRRAATVTGLVQGGPYRGTRNPLYQGNLLLWAGVACWTGRALAPVVSTFILLIFYGLVVRWEEQNLASTLGAPYRDWLARVPRWGLPWPGGEAEGSGDWRAALRSERSTWIAAATVGGAVLAAGRWFA